MEHLESLVGNISDTDEKDTQVFKYDTRELKKIKKNQTI